MRIAIFGAGAVGGYFGGRLAQAGEDVIFIARGAYLHAIQSSGLHVESVRGDFTIYPAQATDQTRRVGEVDAVLVCVKAWQVPEVALEVRSLIGEDTCVTPLVNGVDAPAQLAAALGIRPVLGGLCRISAAITGPGRIRHAGIEPFVAFGELDNHPSTRTERLRQAFEHAEVAVQIPPDIQVAMWEKFLFIAAVSGLGAATRAPLGVLRSLPETRQMLQEVLEEIVAIARKRKIAFSEDIITRTLALIDSLPPDVTPSMQREIVEGRPSELASQNGAVVRMGLESGVATPVNAFIYHSLLPQELQARGQSG